MQDCLAGQRPRAYPILAEEKKLLSLFSDISIVNLTLAINANTPIWSLILTLMVMSIDMSTVFL